MIEIKVTYKKGDKTIEVTPSKYGIASGVYKRNYSDKGFNIDKVEILIDGEYKNMKNLL